MKFRRYLLLAASATLAVSALPALAQSSTTVSNFNQNHAFNVQLVFATDMHVTLPVERYANQLTLDLHWSN